MAGRSSRAETDAASLAAARSLIASALDGSSRPGCIRLHFAAMRVAADASPANPIP
jgi:hypothetical protein